MNFKQKYDSLDAPTIAEIGKKALAQSRLIEWTDAERKADQEYEAQAEALRLVFSEADFRQPAQLIVCSLAIYGWMPKIPRNLLTADVGEDLIKLRSSQSTEFAHFQFLNRSVVGTSKFLHFLAPERYAIWDSNVAVALAHSDDWDQTNCFVAYSSVNSVDRYKRYLEGMRIASSGKSMRDIEFALFRIGRRMRAKANLDG